MTSPSVPDVQTAVNPPRVPIGLAIAALVVGIVAFLSGLVPIWGLIVGTAAVVLGIIALIRGQSKGLALPGLILGALGALASLVTTIVLLVGLGAASTTSLTTGPHSVDAPGSNSASPESPDAEQQTSQVGSRENPAPIGSTVTGSDWTVVVNGFNPDANEIVADSNMYNDASEPGTHYAIVNYTATYTGADSAYAVEVSVALVTATGEVLNSFDNFVVLEDSVGLDELYTGGSVTGSEAFQVPDGVDLTIRVTPGYFQDDAFIAAK